MARELDGNGPEILPDFRLDDQTESGDAASGLAGRWSGELTIREQLEFQRCRRPESGGELQSSFAPAGGQGGDRLPPLSISGERLAETDESAEPGGTRPEAEWTVVVNLTVSKNENGESLGDEMGAAQKLEQLKSLASQSLESPVSRVVQAPGQDSEGNPTVERFEIRDGQVSSLGAHLSRGIGEDLTELLRTASERNPSERIGLILNAHGGGHKGVRGDDPAGLISPEALSEAIKNGLEGSGHENLDILDLDSCLMAQDGVMQEMAEVTGTLVASAEVERMSQEGTNGQNLNAIISDLLSNPSMSGAELGREIVQNAANGNNSAFVDEVGGARRSLSGTHTLACFDLSEAPDFGEALDHFGDSLATAAESPANREVLRSIIEAVPAYQGYETRDLKAFAEKVLEAVDQGRLQDDDKNTLREAATRLLAEHSELTDDYHGDNLSNSPDDYDERGGLAVYLPDAGFCEGNEQTAQEDSPLEWFQRALAKFDDKGLQSLRAAGLQDEEIRRAIVNTVDMIVLPHLENAVSETFPGRQSELGALQAAAERLRKSTTLEEAQEAVRAIVEESVKLEESELGTAMQERAVQEFLREKESIETFQRRLNQPGWNRFLDSLS